MDKNKKIITAVIVVIVIIAAVVLVLHAWGCKNCGVHMSEDMPKKRRR